MTGRWFCWLAAEAIAIALLAGGCSWGGEDAPAQRSGARPPVVVVVFDEFPADDLLRPDGSIDSERFPNFARPRVDLDLVPERPHGLRLDLQGRALDPRRAPAEAAHGVRRPQPQAERLPPGGPARLRGVQGRVGLGRLPARHLPGRAHAQARRARGDSQGAGGRPAGTAGWARSDGGPSRPSTSTTRCCRTSPGSICRRGARTGPPATTRSRASTSRPASTTRGCPSTTTSGTCCRWATRTARSGSSCAGSGEPASCATRS